MNWQFGSWNYNALFDSIHGLFCFCLSWDICEGLGFFFFEGRGGEGRGVDGDEDEHDTVRYFFLERRREEEKKKKKMKKKKMKDCRCWSRGLVIDVVI